MTQTTFAPGSTGSELVLFARTGRLGRILLNRPKAINSLNPEMCRAMATQLEQWADDPQVAAVSVQGAGEKGLCAGGDVKVLRQAVVDDPTSELALEFWGVEYDLDLAISRYPKPYLAIMDGICMGGGMGISTHGSVRVVTERSKLAMPETLIGFSPDVGGLYALARTPGELGTHMALTGSTIGPGDAVAGGLADHYLSSDRIDAWLDEVAETGVPGATQEPPAAKLCGQEWVDEGYRGDDAVAIVERLAARPEPEAQQAAEQIRARSPFAVSVALAALRRAADLSLAEVLEQDLRLGRHFRSEPDFLEGVRCQLVDRDDTPRWRHQRLEDVDRGEVEALFG